ncbi:hypothetical protein [Niastella populi]|uniref:FHA domain-containing protein n=1 Tax=Niastella populi TaxID=550983 RepID=A0A1V9G8D9_9BACT|nr:hypothetical protein [Niastella populi]OQP66738.1 hypothetical protein A4R26_13280 [Niastella populi]
MNKRRVWWAIGLVATFLVFYVLIPIGTWSQAPIFFSIIGAASFLFFLVQLIGDFHTWDEFNTKDKSRHDWRHKVTPLMVLPALGMLILLIIRTVNDESNELKKYGVTTKGIIRDGSGFKTRRGGSFDVTIEFKDENGRWLTVKESVSENEFRRYGKGQWVTIVYSKKHPNIVEILSSDSQVEEYTNVKSREFEIKDLKALLTMKRNDVDSFLNTISYPWTKHDSGWINERKSQFIRISPQSGTVTLVGSFENWQRFPKLFKAENFQEMDSKSNPMLKLFHNDSLYAGVEFKSGKMGRLFSTVSLRLKYMPGDNETISRKH